MDGDGLGCLFAFLLIVICCVTDWFVNASTSMQALIILCITAIICTAIWRSKHG